MAPGLSRDGRVREEKRSEEEKKVEENTRHSSEVHTLAEEKEEEEARGAGHGRLFIVGWPQLRRAPWRA